MSKRVNYAEKGRRYLARVRRAREIIREQEKDAKKLGINSGSLDVLAYVVMTHDIEQDRDIFPGEITEKLDILPAQVSRQINELVGVSYITAGICPADRRRVVLKPTDEGVKQYHSLFEKS